MEAVIARIKEYVTTLYPTILTDLEITDDYLDYMINDVIDRALMFMNRDQLIVCYEEDIVDWGQPNAVDKTVAEKDFWDYYRDFPIPPRLERTIANVIVNSTRTLKNQLTATEGRISSISDNGQSVSYSDKLQHFFNSSDDAEIFSSSLALLKQYRLPTVIRNR